MKISGYAMHAVGEPLRVLEREEAPPGPGQVLVEVAACGVCHTDLGFLYDGVPTRHALPLVLGHEIAGTVVAEGAGVSGLHGAPVIVPAVLPCGRCAVCRRGRGDICRAQVFPGNDVHGGFASHVIVPAAGLCRVPASVSREQLLKLAVCADAVSTAYQAVLNSAVQPGDFAIFVGAGGVGGFGIQVAHALGARVLAIDVDADRLQLVAHHGADWTLNAHGHAAKDLRARVRELSRELALPATEWKIFETSGTKAGQVTAFELLNFGATLGIVGYCPGEVSVKLGNLMAFAARAIGTWGCLPEHFPEVLELVLCGKVAIDPFVTLQPMASINDVFEQLHRRQLKARPVLVPNL
ncbi:MAG: 6-hydroxycyclohex-1-ene-1-carbonyl-CoA dehydrogenase [Planctomycetota bacterium]